MCGSIEHKDKHNWLPRPIWQHRRGESHTLADAERERWRERESEAEREREGGIEREREVWESTFRPHCEASHLRSS